MSEDWKPQPYLPKDMICPFTPGGRCMGSLCAGFVIGPMVCSDVAVARALQFVASYLQDIRDDVRDWKAG
jgi:hypothetical protein